MGEDGATRRRPSLSGARRDESLPRDQRIGRSSEFRAVMSAGSRGVSPYVVAIRLASGDASAPPRLGVVASRKVGGAVQRSRAKRLLREAYRRGRRPSGDLVLIARRGIHEASWTSLVRAYRSAVGMAAGGRRPRRKPGRQGPGGRGQRA